MRTKEHRDTLQRTLIIIDCVQSQSMSSHPDRSGWSCDHANMNNESCNSCH